MNVNKNISLLNYVVKKVVICFVWSVGNKNNIWVFYEELNIKFLNRLCGLMFLLNFKEFVCGLVYILFLCEVFVLVSYF